MLTVVFDTNALFGDPWLRSGPGKELLELAGSGACEVVIPAVVHHELRRRRLESQREIHEKAVAGIAAVARAGIDVTTTKAQLEQSFEQFQIDMDAAFMALFEMPGVILQQAPQIDVQRLVQRDLDRRRPFLQVEGTGLNGQSIGFRDTVIWETVLSLLDPKLGRDRVLFATSDQGFTEGGSSILHPDLVDDLNQFGIESDRVAIVKNAFQAKAEVKQAAEIAAIIRVATDALYELVGEGVGQRMVHGGDYDYPDFVKFDFPGFEGATIYQIDQYSEFELSSDGALTTATVEAIVYLEGALYKGDWYADENPSFHVGSEINRHYFEASDEVTVNVVVEIDTSGAEPELLNIELRGVSDETEDPTDEDEAIIIRPS